MSAIIVPLPPREEASMSSDDDDLSVPTEATEPWRQLDVEATAPYDDAFFDALAGDIEAAIDADTVTPLRRKWAAPMALAAAALLAFAWAWSGPSVPSPDAHHGALAADPELEALARAVGRAARESLADDDVDSAMFASVQWLAAPDDDLGGSPFALEEELDDLDDDELSTLFVPL